MIENVDYFIHFVSWPTGKTCSCVTTNEDGTYSIFIDKDLPSERQHEAILHELMHLNQGHLFLNDVSVDKAERRAREL